MLKKKRGTITHRLKAIFLILIFMVPITHFSFAFTTPENIGIYISTDSVYIEWDPILDATSYKVYSSNNPYSGFVEDISGTYIGTSWIAPIGEEKKFYYVTAVKLPSKNGGLIFRVDDDRIQSQKLQWADVFDQYGYKCNWAINSYWADSLIAQEFQSRGHELLDHTPNHNTEYFIVRELADTSYFSGEAGVDSISSNGYVFLERSFPDTSTCGYDGTARTVAGTPYIVNVSGDTIPNFVGYIYVYNSDGSKNNHEGWYNYYRYSGKDTISTALRKLPHSFTSNDTFKIYAISNRNVTLTVNGTMNLMKASLIQFNQLGLERPRIWIHPGGCHPAIQPDTIMVAGQLLGYWGASDSDALNNEGYNIANGRNSSYNNPRDYARWATYWGQFSLDSHRFNVEKTVIADGVQKHRALVGHNHFSFSPSVYPGGFEDYLTALDSTLYFCQINNIPVGTYSEWWPQLYDSIPDPYINIMPPLCVDLDENNFPDGYYRYSGAVYDTTDGVMGSDFCSILQNSNGYLWWISQIFGIEKGNNEFVIWTKGTPGKSIKVRFRSFNADFNQLDNVYLKFPANTSDWTRYTEEDSENGITTLIFDNDCLFLYIYCYVSDYSGGIVKTSGMELRKKR